MTSEEAQTQLDNHVREIIAWHFSPETGCPFWLEWAQKNFDPRGKVNSYADIVAQFPHFQDEWLRDLQPEVWIPAAFKGKPFSIFETGGTTGMPKQRIGWEDYKTDYTEFSEHYGPDFFPQGANWLMVGPTGPRRLRLAIEHLANIRGGACYFIDLDPRWVKRLIGMGEMRMAKAYQEHVIDQAATIIRHRDIGCLFTTPKLLESLAERMSLADAGIRGVPAVCTTMTPQYLRFIEEEENKKKINYAPTYGNTLMGLAISRKRAPGEYSLTYHAPQPRAVLRIVDPENTDRVMDYGEYGRVELTTLTKEFFMPRFLERDEAIRREPCEEFPWDGVGDVRPFQSGTKTVIEGVY